jgi:hypothetical protein
MALLLCKLKYSALGGMKTGITDESPLKLWGTLHGDMAQTKIRPRLEHFRNCCKPKA